MTLFQYFILAGTLVFLIIVLRTVCRGKLKEAYALLWIVAALVTGVLTLFPDLLKALRTLLGIQTPAFALLLCMVGAILLLLFQITLIISDHQEKITRLMEESALLRAELEKKK